jgi:hypothetical protein
LEAVQRDYAPRGIQFFYVYKALAHPGMNGYVDPVTVKERLLHVQEAKRTLGTQIPWLCDNLEDELKHAMGDRPNSQFIFDESGRIARIWSWSDADELREELVKIAGPVEHPTTVDQLHLKIEPRPASKAASGVVPRVSVPSGSKPLIIRTEKSENPFYVKLRVDADKGILTEGTGSLVLGFHLDPIHRVHWNNLAAPLRYEIEIDGEALLEPLAGEGPKVEAETDVDPREFLLSLEDADLKKPLTVTAHFFVCHDVEGWCKAMTQRYTIELREDKGAGRASRGGSEGMRGRGPGAGRGGGPGGGRDAGGRFERMDADGDGKLSRTEFPGPDEMFERLDANNDGGISQEEMQAGFSRRRGGGQGSGRGRETGGGGDDGDDDGQ